MKPRLPIAQRPPLKKNFLTRHHTNILTEDGELNERRIKTDRRDARALREACRLGAYRPAHRTSDRQRDVRAHLAVRGALIRTRSKYISLIDALARREGCRT